MPHKKKFDQFYKKYFNIYYLESNVNGTSNISPRMHELSLKDENNQLSLFEYHTIYTSF